MINLVNFTRTDEALENIIDTLVFPESDKKAWKKKNRFYILAAYSPQRTNAVIYVLK